MSQQTRLLARLKQGPVTKIEVIYELGIINVGGRILDLRAKGHQIKTTMVEVRNRWKEKSRVAEYSL